jgi:hypothetical protein
MLAPRLRGSLHVAHLVHVGDVGIDVGTGHGTFANGLGRSYKPARVASAGTQT